MLWIRHCKLNPQRSAEEKILTKRCINEQTHKHDDGPVRCQTDEPPFVPLSSQWCARCCFPAAGSDPRHMGGISAGLLAQRKQLADNALRGETRRVFITCVWTPRKDIFFFFFLNNRASNNRTRYTIVVLPRGAALSLRQTQETLRSLGGCAYLTAAGPMEICADWTPPGCSQWKNPKMPSCRWIRPLNGSMAGTSTSAPQLLFGSARVSNCARPRRRFSWQYIGKACFAIASRLSARLPPWHAYTPKYVSSSFCVCSLDEVVEEGRRKGVKKQVISPDWTTVIASHKSNVHLLRHVAQTPVLCNVTVIPFHTFPSASSSPYPLLRLSILLSSLLHFFVHFSKLSWRFLCPWK